jgi:hypothetical protein
MPRDAYSHICTACGTLGRPKMKVKGSFIIELALWLCFLLPGIIYSVWRSTTRGPCCPQCGARDMIPKETPRGAALMRQYYPNGVVREEEYASTSQMAASNTGDDPALAALLKKLS